jgi:hypothetical protein
LKIALRDQAVSVDPATQQIAQVLIDLGIMIKPIFAVSALAVWLDAALRTLPAGQ